MLRFFVLVLVLSLRALSAEEQPVRTPQEPSALQQLNILGKTVAWPKHAWPEEIRAAKNGALYVLLPNGAELIVKEKRNAPVVAVQGWVRTGAIHEREFMGAGLSHYCEHLLFKGTLKRPPGRLDQEIRGGGGDNNAYTSSERTVYHVTTETAGWKNSFDCIADMLMNSTFPEADVRKEHGVVTKEIERSIDNADRALYEAYDRLVYQVHPYRVPVLGYPERFKSVTREEVYAYYKRRYTPQLTTFIVVGDVEATEALVLMAETIAPWKRANVDEVPVPEEPPQVAPRAVTVRHPLCQVPKFYLGYPTVSLRHPDLYALDVLASILGDGRSSRLYKKVQHELNLALEIGCYSYTPQYPGAFTVYATVEAKQLEQARAAVLAVLEECKTRQPTLEELTRAKRKVQAQRVFAQMNAEGVAEALGSDWLVAGDMDFSQTYEEGVAQVTAEACVRVAKQYIDAQKLNMAVLLPEEKNETQTLPEQHKALGQGPPQQRDDSKIWTKALHEAMKSPRADTEALKKAREVFEKMAIAGGKVSAQESAAAKSTVLKHQPTVAAVNQVGTGDALVHEIKLKSGLRLVVREDQSLPAVHVSFTLLGGQRWEPEELPGAAHVLANMLNRGTTHKTKLEIAALVEGLGASLDTFGGRSTYGINLRCLKDDLSQVFALGAECLLESAFSDAELAKVKHEVGAAIEQEEEDLWVVNSKLLRPLLYGAHPYGRPVSGTSASVTKITVADLTKLHAQWTRPTHLAMGLVGDLTALEALELVNKHFGAFKGQGEFQGPQHGCAPLVGQKRGEKVKAGIEGVVLALGFSGVNLKSADRETLNVMAALLSGLGGRLSVVVREQLGAAYSVGAYHDSQLDGGHFVFHVQTTPDMVEKLKAVFLEHVKKLRDEVVPEKEIESIRHYLAGNEAISLQDQADVAQRLALSQLYEEGADSVFNRRERLVQVTAQAIQAAARKYLDPAHCVWAIVKPE